MPTRMLTGSELTGRKQLIQVADGVELSKNAIKGIRIVPVLQVEDTLKGKDDFEWKFLTGSVLP